MRPEARGECPDPGRQANRRGGEQHGQRGELGQRAQRTLPDGQRDRGEHRQVGGEHDADEAVPDREVGLRQLAPPGDDLTQRAHPHNHEYRPTPSSG
ncbi:MAG TPA: hypothetical protein VKP64_04330 [Mycobacteriales bacterium]|nr:hypothetical protein [Mycobacteriales bacterium]